MVSEVKKLESVVRAFTSKKGFQLRRISNEFAEEAALSRDMGLAEISIIAYSLHKLLSKHHIVENPKWETARNSIIKTLNLAVEALKTGNNASFRKKLMRAGDEVTKLDRSLGRYMQRTIEKARMRQASRAYAAGISMMSAAELMDTDAKQLQNYIGNTRIHDEVVAKKGIRKRLNDLEKALESEE